jgi:uncharacterized protein YndB with AHSA1/START domain
MTVTEKTRSIVVEREMPHPPEKIWRALTQSALIAQWLMPNDFAPVVGHTFNFRSKPIAGWNGVADCEVLVVEPPHRLVWRQDASGDQAATGLKSTVSWTLTRMATGTHVRMEHAGFRPQDDLAFEMMGNGWPRVVVKLQHVTADLQ